MEPEIKKPQPKEETFELIFKNGALANLKKLAERLGISEDDLAQAVNKSIKLLSTIKSVDTQTITLETKDKKRYILNPDNF